jgi:stage V sporulation protein D (sporulation-specific penicillin-binding protein)
MLYPESDNVQMLSSTVPNLSGKTAIECMEALRDANLNCSIEGDVMGICTGQSDLPGSIVFSGSIVTVTLENTAIAVDSGEGLGEVDSEDGVVSEDGADTDTEEGGAVG